MNSPNKLNDLTYEKFKKLATDNSLSIYERIGFYNHLRELKEGEIFQDIIRKIPNLTKEKQLVIDIGCGCSNLPNMLIELCRAYNHQLVLVDSTEMLDLLPDDDFITKVCGQFPLETTDVMNIYKSKADVIISYSVFHYVFAEMPYMNFIDESLGLLNKGGQMLLGDLPNHSKKNRFFSSEAGIAFHKKNNNTNELPVIDFNSKSCNTMDDDAILGIMEYARKNGLESYLVPQNESLPFGNRREDLLFYKY